MPPLGALLKRQRERHGWTQQEVVERAGLERSSSYISSLETGKTSPSVEELDALARLFGSNSQSGVIPLVSRSRSSEVVPNNRASASNSSTDGLVLPVSMLEI